MSAEFNIGDIVQLRKKHPCGSDLWKISRIGVDIGLVCQGCQRRVMIPRSTLVRRVKKMFPSAGDGKWREYES